MHRAADGVVLLAQQHRVASGGDPLGCVQPGRPPTDDEDVDARLWHVRRHYKRVRTDTTFRIA